MLLKFLRKFFNRLARYYSLGQSLSGGFFFGGERRDLRKLLDNLLPWKLAGFSCFFMELSLWMNKVRAR